MEESILGARIRQRRREIGLTQAELAKKIGISASYLNLIEWNKRRIAGTLLRKTANALEFSLEDLAGATEERLLGTLREVAHMPALFDFGIEENLTNEFIGRFPGWARGMAALARSEHEATARVRILSDRLSNDPFLSETLHHMMTRIAAIRSAAEILTEHAEIPKTVRTRFTRIVHEESRTLSETGEALTAYLDAAEDTDRILTPVDEVESLFEARDNHFDEIDEAANDVVHLISSRHPAHRRTEAADLADQRLLGVIDEIIRRQPQVKTAAARGRAQRALRDYAVGAILMPAGPFGEVAAELHYDIEALTEAFSVEFEAVCHRLTALPSQDGVPQFGYFRANAAGTIIEMLGLKGLTIPRYAAACPLWALYRAQVTPEVVVRQRALFPSGSRFVFVARAGHTGASGFGKPRHYITDMLAMREDHARHTIYEPERSVMVEEVGPSCRLCPRLACEHRIEDPFSE